MYELKFFYFFFYIDIELFQQQVIKRLPILHWIAFVPLSKINCIFMFVGLFLDFILFH